MEIRPNSEHLTRVPLSALRSTLGGHGRRHAKRRNGWYEHVPIRGFSTANEKGNLLDDEYRFWIGSAYADIQTSVCRFCRAIMLSKQERKSHQQDGSCCRKLVTIYGMMLAAVRMECGVCGMFCTESRWGVPLHQGCIHDWKFSRQELEGLEAFKRRALAQGRIAL